LFTGPPIPSSVLRDFVQHGGNVYLYGGTNYKVSAGEEAARWAPFLKSFGIQFAPEYRSTSGFINVSGFAAEQPLGPDLFTGIRYLENVDDQPLSYIDPNFRERAQIFGDGYFAAGEIPEPSTGILLTIGLCLLLLRFKPWRTVGGQHFPPEA
jgi:hypothetical protein